MLSVKRIKWWHFAKTLPVAALLLLQACGGGGTGSSAPTLQSLDVSPVGPSVAVGTSVQATATAVYSDGSKIDVTTQVAWTSSNTAVATIGAATGKAVGVASGTSTLGASYQGKAGNTTLTVTAAQLSRIDLTPTTPSIAAGTTVSFLATGTFSDNLKQDLSADIAWTSSNTTVATILSSGKATGVAAGSATITATCSIAGVCNAMSATTLLTVTPAVLVSISVTPPNPVLALGTGQQFVATGIYGDGTHQDLSGLVTWSSSSTSVATISNTSGSLGVAASKGIGTTNITATFSGVTAAPVTLSVTAASVVSIAVTPANASIALGTNQQFKAVGTYTDNSTQDLTGAVTWVSGTAAVASVSNSAGSYGLASSRTAGTTQISASVGAVSSSAVTLTVTPAVIVSIAVTPPTPAIPLGTQQQFTATATYSDNTTQNLTTAVTWSSSAGSVATISNASGSNGLASSIATGTSQIQASSGGITSGGVALTVTPAVLVSISVTPAAPSIALGTAQGFIATGTYSDMTTQNLTTSVTWTSSASTVASISNAAGTNGLATSLTVGTTNISAGLGGVISPNVVLTVTTAALVSISVTPPTPSVALGLTEPFMATGIYTDNTHQDLTTVVSWASGTPSVAAISNVAGSNGVATSLATGTTLITANLSGITSAPATLTVTPVVLMRVTVTPANPGIALGGSQQFTATGTYSDNSNKDLTATVTWVSGTPAVASISNAAGSVGLATSLTVGTTQVSASLGAVSSSAVTLTVTPAVLVSIAVTPTPGVSIPLGNTRQFAATGTYSDGTTQLLTTAATWTSGTPAVATISNAAGSNALATSLSLGVTNISATLSGVSSNVVTLTVTPAVLVSIVVTPANPRVPIGSSQPLKATGLYSDGSMQVLTTTVTWFSSKTAVATISNASGSNGLVSVAGTVTTGSTSTIAATLGAVSGSATLTAKGAGYVYVANYASGTVSQYVISGTGALTVLASPIASGASTSSAPFAVAADPGAAHLYVANAVEGTVSQYAIGTDGTLSALNVPTIAAGTSPSALTVDPTGLYTYVTDYAANLVYQFSIGAGGTLSALTVPTTGSGSGPLAVVVHPGGHYLYVANSLDGTVSQFTVAAGGALTPMAVPVVATGLAATSTPDAIVINPLGTFAYVANAFDNSIQQFAIGADGHLTAVAAPAVAAGGFTVSMAIDPTGSYLYAANSSGSTVSQYSIDAAGALTLLAAAPALAGTAPNAVALDPSGLYAYVVNQSSNDLSEFVLGAGGALVSQPSPTIATGNTPNAVATVAAR